MVPGQQTSSVVAFRNLFDRVSMRFLDTRKNESGERVQHSIHTLYIRAHKYESLVLSQDCLAKLRQRSKSTIGDTA
jgi:hypothetical protein